MSENSHRIPNSRTNPAPPIGEARRILWYVNLCVLCSISENQVMDFRNLGMDLRSFGIDNSILSTIQDVLDMAEDHDNSSKGTQNNPSRAYVRDSKAMAATPADVEEYQNSYVFIMDMPGIKASDIKVQVEDENVLVISGERKRDKEDGVKYLRMERRVGKFMRKFSLPENANVDAISAVCQDGVLIVTVQKLPPPETKKSKTIEVKVG